MSKKQIFMIKMEPNENGNTNLIVKCNAQTNFILQAIEAMREKLNEIENGLLITGGINGKKAENQEAVRNQRITL